MSESGLQTLLTDLHAEDLIELAESLSADAIDLALQGMKDSQRRYYEVSTQYEDDQIGRYVDHELLILPKSATVKLALQELKRSFPESSPM